MPKCTIVVPCYNEADRIAVVAFRRFIVSNRLFRFVFVDDGSTDATKSVLHALCASAPSRFAMVGLRSNRGKAEAVRQGILRAIAEGADYVGYWDADLATPLDAIHPFIELLEQNRELEIVIGSRVKLLGRSIERRRLRHYAGRIFATAASFVLRLPIYDTQCGAKLFRVTPQILDLFEHPFRTNWCFDVELIARFLRQRKSLGLPPVEKSMYEWPLLEWRDVAGSKVRPLDFFKAMCELYTIHAAYFRRQRRQEKLPIEVQCYSFPKKKSTGNRTEENTAPTLERPAA